MGMFFLYALALSSTYESEAVSTRIYTSFSNSLLSVRYCSFDSLSSTNYGGAILVNDVTVNVQIYSTIFTNCSSISHGGAIYINASTSVASSCCFYLCCSGASGSSGQGTAIFTSCVSTLNYKLLSALQCPASSAAIADNAVFRFCNPLNASNLNSSFCHITYSGNFVAEGGQQPSSVYFVGSYSHSSANAAGFHNCNQNDIFQYANCVNISNAYGALFLWYNDSVVIRDYIFIDCCSGTLAYCLIGDSTIQFIGCFTNLQYEAGDGATTIAGSLSYTSTGILPLSLSQLGTYVCSGEATPYGQTHIFSSNEQAHFAISKISASTLMIFILN